MGLINPAGITAVASDSIPGSPATAAVNGVGMSGNVHIKADENNWISGDDPFLYNKWIRVDLGDVYTLDKIDIWSLLASSYKTKKGAKRIDLHYSLQPGTNEDGDQALFDLDGYSELKLNHICGEATQDGLIHTNPSYATINTSVTARYVAIGIDSVFSAGGNTTGFGQIQFHGTLANGTGGPEQYTITVNSGSGSGAYDDGTAVNITADAAPSGEEFSVWTGDISILADPSAASTIATLSGADALVTANYQVIPPVDESFDTSDLVATSTFKDQSSKDSFVKMINDANDQMIRVAVFGDSQESDHTGSGKVYIPRLNYEAVRRYGNVGETGFIPVIQNGTMWLSACVEDGVERLIAVDATLGTDTTIPPGMPIAKVDSQKLTFALYGANENDGTNEIERILDDGEEGLFLDDVAGGVHAEIFCVVKSGSGQLQWESRPDNDSDTLIHISRSVTNSNVSNVVLDGSADTEGKIVKIVTDDLELYTDPGGDASNNRHRIQLRLNGIGGPVYVCGVRFVGKPGKRYGMTFTSFSRGGYTLNEHLTSHPDIQQSNFYQAMDFHVSAIHLGANDAGRTLSTSDYKQQTLQLIDLIRLSSGDVNHKIILMSDPDNNNLTWTAQEIDNFNRYAGVHKSIAQSDANVMAINSHRLCVDNLDWVRDGNDLVGHGYLKDEVHYNAKGARALASEEMSEFFGYTGVRFGPLPTVSQATHWLAQTEELFYTHHQNVQITDGTIPVPISIQSSIPDGATKAIIQVSLLTKVTWKSNLPVNQMILSTKSYVTIGSQTLRCASTGIIPGGGNHLVDPFGNEYDGTIQRNDNFIEMTVNINDLNSVVWKREAMFTGTVGDTGETRLGIVLIGFS